MQRKHKMVTIVKHEWHQVDSQFAYELDEDTLSQIYPDLKKKEIKKMLKDIENGEVDVETIIDDAWNEGVDIEWDRQYDDWWTDRKGGYEVTYELGDESSWHHEPPPPEPTHKCTKCKWTGQSYDAEWQWPEDDEQEAKKVCPYCESDVELTEHGIQKAKEDEEQMAEWNKEFDENAECTSCEWTGPEEDTLTIEGQMCCPECREPVWTAEQVKERDDEEMRQALEELTNELDKSK